MTLSAGVLAVAFVVSIGAHILLVLGLARRSWWRAPLAIVIPPLAPYWGWQLGMRRPVAVWWVAVVAYAVGVTLLTP